MICSGTGYFAFHHPVAIFPDIVGVITLAAAHRVIAGSTVKGIGTIGAH